MKNNILYIFAGIMLGIALVLLYLLVRINSNIVAMSRDMSYMGKQIDSLIIGNKEILHEQKKPLELKID